MAIRMWKGKNPDTDKGPEHFDISYEGKVLAVGEHNHYDDSDFYAVVWDEETGQPKEVGYGTTRFWTYYNHATVDATDEVRAKYDAWQAARRAEIEKANAERDAKIPYVNRHVRVVKGRKVPIGTEGTVFWYGQDQYARNTFRVFDDGREGKRIGIRTDSGDKYFTAATNVEVISG